MRLITLAIVLLSILLLSIQCFAQWAGAEKGRGFLCNPHVYVNNEPDIPLTGLGVIMPKPGEIQPDIDFSGQRADHWNVNGHNVQPALDYQQSWIRVGALRGFQGGWAVGVSIPWFRNQVKGDIGGFPAHGVGEGIGNVSLYGKKILWQDCKSGRQLIGAVGFDLPVGVNDQSFGPDNIVTNGYFADRRMRMPLGWQPSTGTFNGLFALSYGRTWQRVAWQALMAGKIYGTDDEDVKLGNVFIGEVNGTYGISRDLAGSLGFTVRSQGDDSYPNSPLPVNGPLLEGTTNHSTIVYLDLGVRYTVMHKVTVGVGIRTPIMNPDSGMDPSGTVSIIVYPNIND